MLADLARRGSSPANLMIATHSINDSRALNWLLAFYILATFKVISGHEPTCESAHSWRLYSAAPLGNQTAMTRHPILSHYPDTEPT